MAAVEELFTVTQSNTQFDDGTKAKLMNTSLNPKNLHEESWLQKPRWGIGKTKIGWRVTHTPTGISAESADYAKSDVNKQAAHSFLESLVARHARKNNHDSVREVDFLTNTVVDEAEIANAMDVLKAYPGREANEARLAVWEAMRDSVINE